jgi:hypothetical protein
MRWPPTAARSTSTDCSDGGAASGWSATTYSTRRSRKASSASADGSVATASTIAGKNGGLSPL